METLGAPYYQTLLAEDDPNWCLESGTSSHFTKTEDLFENSRLCCGKVLAANKGSMSDVAKGATPDAVLRTVYR